MSTSGTNPYSLNQPRAPRRKWLTPFVGVTLWTGTVLVISSVISSVVWFLGATSVPTTGELDAWLWNSRDAKLTALREVYNGKPDAKDERILSLEKFLTQTPDGAQSEGAKWVKLVDADRFRARVIRAPWMKSISFVYRKQMVSQPLEHFSVGDMDDYDQINVLRIVPWGRGGNSIGRSEGHQDEVLAYALVSRRYRDSEPVLFWLTENNGAWKLVDWEEVETGYPESESCGLHGSAYVHRLAEDYSQALQHLRNSDGILYDNPEEFQRQLRQAEARRVPPQVQELMLYMLMNRWSNRNYSDQVLRLAKQVKNPDRMPGFHLIELKAYENLGDPDNTLAKIAHLEQLIGLRPELIKLRAQLLERSDRRDEAVEQWRRMADNRPDDALILNELNRVLPKSQKGEVIQRIKSSHEPAKLAYQFANFASERVDLATLRELADFVKQVAPESSQVQDLEVVCLLKENKHVDAAEHYRRLAEKADDDEAKRENWTAYFYQMSLAGRLLEAFNSHPDPKAAFQMLVVANARNYDDDDERVVDQDQIPALLDAYRQKNPSDPWIAFYDGQIAANQHRYADADKILAALEKRLAESKDGSEKSDTEKTGEDQDGDAASKPDADDGPAATSGLADQLRHERCRVRYELGEDVEVLEYYKNNESVYQVLSNLAVQYQHWIALDRLNQTFARANGQNAWLLTNQTRVLIAGKKFDEARHRLRLMERRQEKETWLKYTRESLERELAEAETPVRSADISQGIKSAPVFKQLAHEFMVERNWAKLDQLCMGYQGGANDPDVKNARLEQAWRQGDDARFLELLANRPVVAASSYAESTWRERQVRSLMRLGRQDEAEQKAQEAKRRFGEEWLSVLTRIEKHDVAGLLKLLDENEQLNRQWGYHDFFKDTILRKVLIDDAFEPLRQQRKLSFINSQFSEGVVLLLRVPSTPTEDHLRQRLAGAGEAPVQLTQVSPERWIIDRNDCRYVLFASSEPYFSEAELAEPAFAIRKEESLTDTSLAFQEQKAYWQIAPLIVDDDLPWEATNHGVREIGSLLISPEVTGVVITPRFGQHLNVVQLEKPETEPPTTELLSESQLNGKGCVVNGRFRPKSLSPAMRQTLAAMACSNEPKPEMTATVQLCEIERLLTAEGKVHEIQYQHGQLQLIVEFVDGVAGLPELRRGTKFVIPIDRTLQVQMPSP